MNNSIYSEFILILIQPLIVSCPRTALRTKIGIQNNNIYKKSAAKMKL